MFNDYGKMSPELTKKIQKLHDNNGIYMAEVMDTRSPENNGDIKVWVFNSGTDKKNPINWVIAHCITQFGSTIYEQQAITDAFINQPTSYGIWNPIPYVGNYVFIFYPNTVDDSTNAYWFGSPITGGCNMLPGIAYDLKKNVSSTDYTPVCDKNYKVENVQDPKEYPVLNNALKKQGLNEDRLRGISTASSNRDNPSHCYGFLSPLGNQMVIDDGWSLGDSNVDWNTDPRPNNNSNSDKDDYGKYFAKKDWISSLDESDKDNKLNRFHGGFRFRTRNGTQILIMDAGTIYMINQDGSAWVELSNDGYIDCYSASGISASTNGDINLHGHDINIESNGTISMKSVGGIFMETSGAHDVLCSEMKVSSRLSVPTLDSTNGQINSLKVSNGQINGIFSGSLQGTAYYATYAGMMPINQELPDAAPVTLDEVLPITTQEVAQKGTDTISSITTRMPTHEPWGGHNKNDVIPKLETKKVMLKTNKSNKDTDTTVSNIIRG